MPAANPLNQACATWHRPKRSIRVGYRVCSRILCVDLKTTRNCSVTSTTATAPSKFTAKWRHRSGMAKHRILILGGGFSGLYTALELERLLKNDADTEITLVNRDNFFLFTPMLHEVAASDLDVTNIVNPMRKLLRHVKIFVGEVQAVDLVARRVTVTQGFIRHEHALEYDHLILGLGSVTNFFGIPGLAERA